MFGGKQLILRFFSTLSLTSRVVACISRPSLKAARFSSRLSTAPLVAIAAVVTPAPFAMALGTVVFSPALEAVPGPVFVRAEWLALRHRGT
jgi:hypothetical protein